MTRCARCSLSSHLIGRLARGSVASKTSSTTPAAGLCRCARARWQRACMSVRRPSLRGPVWTFLAYGPQQVPHQAGAAEMLIRAHHAHVLLCRPSKVCLRRVPFFLIYPWCSPSRWQGRRLRGCDALFGINQFQCLSPPPLLRFHLRGSSPRLLRPYTASRVLACPFTQHACTRACLLVRLLKHRKSRGARLSARSTRLVLPWSRFSRRACACGAAPASP
jgi:hypothetical protein